MKRTGIAVRCSALFKCNSLNTGYEKRPEQPVSRILFPFQITPKRTTTIHLKDADCPAPRATYPGARTGSPQTLPYLVLHRVGFAKLPRSPGELVRSYRTFSPLPRLKRGGILSVALSFALPRLHVMEHPALWCSDFPPGQTD